MGLIIALDDNGRASGELFWDDGESRGTLCIVHVCVHVYRIECTQVNSECCDLTFFFSYFPETVENDKYVHYNFIVENVSFTSVNAPSSKSTLTVI